MTNEEPRKRSYSLRYFFAIIGVLVFGWKVVTGFHDISIGYDGLRCVGGQLGPAFYEHWKQDRKWVKKNRWNQAAISYIETYSEPVKKQVIETLNYQCSEYIYVGETYTSTMNGESYIVGNHMMVNNWARSGYSPFMRELDPAISDKRIKSMLIWAAFVLFCIVDIRKLNKIFIWSRDD